MANMIWNPDGHMRLNNPYEAYHTVSTVWTTATFHSHPCYEVYLFIHGSTRVLIENRLFDMRGGDMLVIPPGCMHRNMPMANNYNYDRTVFYVTEAHLRSVSTPECDLAGIFDHVTATAQYHYHLEPDLMENIVAMEERMSTLAARDDTLSGVILASLSTTLIGTICEVIRDVSPDLGVQDTSRAARVLKYVNQHFAEPLSLDSLASRFYVSKYHLSREFKEYTGTTIHQYQIRKRIGYALSLMQRGMMPMQAAQSCGFADYPSFFRDFKRLTGRSPQDYLRDHAVR